MAKNRNIGQDPLPTPAPALSAGGAKLPYKRGATKVTDFTKQQLEQVGWQEGDPVPGDLGEVVAKLAAEAASEDDQVKIEDTELAKGWQPPTPKFVKIEDLPAEKQKELQDFLQDYKRQAEKEAQQQETLREIEASIPESATPEVKERLREQMLADHEAATNPPPPPPPKQAEDDDKLKLPPLPQNCARCQWPVAEPFKMEATDQDKQEFLITVLGGIRFTRVISLLGGNMQVTLRSLTTAESVMISQQLGSMVRVGEIRGDVEYTAKFFEYRLALGVARVVAGGQVIYEAPESIATWTTEHPPANGSELSFTPLPRFVTYFQENGVRHEHVRRMVGSHHQNFQRLVEHLEIMADEPSFWGGIDISSKS